MNDFIPNSHTDPNAEINISDLTDSIEQTKEFLITNRNFQDLNPLSAGYEKCNPGHFFGPWIRNFYIIHYIQNGKGYFIRENEEENKLSKGDLFLIRPAELCKYYADVRDPWSYVWIGFSGHKAAEFIESTGFHGNRCILHSPGAEHIFSEIQNTKLQNIALEFFLCSKIYELLAFLHTAKPENEYAEKAVNYICSNYSNRISIEQISKLLNIDRRHLGRLFITHTGVTPKEFLINIRMKNAVSLLHNSDYTVAEIAMLVGYDDYDSFLKIFKKKFGMSPSQYRTNA